MAHHKSAKKRIRQDGVKRLRNRYRHKTTRNAIKALREETSKAAAQKKLPEVLSMIDKIAQKNIIHKSKAGNLKSKLTKHVNAL